MNELNKVQDQLIKEQDLLISLLEQKSELDSIAQQARHTSSHFKTMRKMEKIRAKAQIKHLCKPILSLEQLKAFFKRPGINMAGICKEADVSQQYVSRKFAEGVLPGEKVTEKLLKVIRMYGF